MHGGISSISRHLAAPQDSCICGHIWASQTWGSGEFLCTHSSMQGQETHEFPQVWLGSDRQENTSGETWTVGHVKSRPAQEMQPAEEAGGIRGGRQARQLGFFSSHLLPEGKPALASLGDRNAKLVLLLDCPVLGKRSTRHGATPSPCGAARNNTNLTSHTSWRRGLIWLQELLEREPNLPSSSHGPLHLPPDPVPFLA